MSLEGEIIISIAEQKGSLSHQTEVTICSSRKTNIADLLKGKRRNDAIHILPAIFSVCREAHREAAARACSLKGRECEERIRGQLLILCENAREYLFRIFTGWNIDNKSDYKIALFKEINALLNKMKLATADESGKADISSSRNQGAITDIASQISNILRRHVFAVEPEAWLLINGDQALRDWALQTRTVPASYINTIYNNNWQSSGSVEMSFLPDIQTKDLVNKMHDGDDNFISQPEWKGKPNETGPMARKYKHPLIDELIAKYGAALLARQVSRLVELAEIPEDIKALITQKNQKPIKQKPGTKGFGQVETARGQLTHSVILNGEEIIDYKILAPTEWNFHPHGVVRNSLTQLIRSNSADQEKLTKLIIEAIDPCVPYQVRII